MRRRAPLLGQFRTVSGQTFVVWRLRRHRARAGHVVSVLRWLTTCAEPSCGLPFDFETSRKPSPFDPPTCCPSHRGTRAERRERRRRRAWILAQLVAEDPDGTLVTMAGDPVERDPHSDGEEATAWT